MRTHKFAFEMNDGGKQSPKVSKKVRLCWKWLAKEVRSSAYVIN